MYVCMYVCMYLCMHERINVGMCVAIFVIIIDSSFGM